MRILKFKNLTSLILQKKKHNQLNIISDLTQIDSPNITQISPQIQKYVCPFLYICFIFSGIIKRWLIYFDYNSGIDLSVLILVLLGLSLVIFERPINIANSKFQTRDQTWPFVTLMITMTWYILTSLWTISPAYYLHKIMNIFFLFIIFVVPYFCTDDFEKRFLTVLLMFSICISALYLPILIYYKFFVYGVYDNPIIKWYLQYGMLIGIIFLYIYTKSELDSHPFIKYGLLSLAVTFLLLISARGPIFSLAFVVFIHLMVCRKIQWLSIRNISKAILIASLLIILFNIGSDLLSFLPEDFVLKIKRVFLLANFLQITNLDFHSGLDSENMKEGMGYSVNYRAIQIYNSFQYLCSDIYTFIFGTGLGSFGILQDGIDKRNYPHNFLIEILVEAGLVGFFLTIANIVIYMRFIVQREISKTDPALVFVLAYSVCCFLTSFSISEMRLPIAIMGVILFMKHKVSVNNYICNA